VVLSIDRLMTEYSVVWSTRTPVSSASYLAQFCHYRDMMWWCDVVHWQVDDRVLCRVIHKDSGLECFVPGTVLLLPRRPENNFFTVLLYTGRRVRPCSATGCTDNHTKNGWEGRYLKVKKHS